MAFGWYTHLKLSSLLSLRLSLHTYAFLNTSMTTRVGAGYIVIGVMVVIIIVVFISYTRKRTRKWGQSITFFQISYDSASTPKGLHATWWTMKLDVKYLIVLGGQVLRSKFLPVPTGQERDRQFLRTYNLLIEAPIPPRKENLTHRTFRLIHQQFDNKRNKWLRSIKLTAVSPHVSRQIGED